MQQTVRTTAIDRFLEQHRIPTLNIAGILEHEAASCDIFVDDPGAPEAVLVKGPWFWYLHTESEAFLDSVIQEMSRNPGFYRFSGVWRPIAERIKRHFTLVWESPCDLYYLPEGNVVPPREGSVARSIDLQDAEVIDAHYAYRHPGSLEKIRRDIQHRASSAVYVDDQIVSWLLVHEDNSMGIMFTLEAHRRKGYAVDVSLDLVAKLRAAGKSPFLQIREDNTMSPGLATRCGFIPYGKCAWFGVLSGIPKELIEGAAALRSRALEGCCPVGHKGTGLRMIACRETHSGYLLEPSFTASEAAEVWAEVQRQGHAGSLWITTPLDEPGGVEELVATGRLDPDGERTCLCLFLVNLGPADPGEAPLDNLPEDAWLDVASRTHDRSVLKAALAHMGPALHRVGDATGAAALLDDGEGNFELLWPTCQDRAFLRRVLRHARLLKLDTAVVHVAPAEAGVYQDLGFLPVYTERQYRCRPLP